MSEPSASRLPLFIASLLALLWFGFIGWAVAVGKLSPGADLPSGLGVAALVLVPVSTVFAVAAAIGRAPPSLPFPDARSHPLEAGEANLAGLAARIDALAGRLEAALTAIERSGEALGSEAAALERSAAKVTAAADGAVAAGRTLDDRLPRAATAAEALREGLAAAAEEALRQEAAAAAAGARWREGLEANEAAALAAAGALGDAQDRLAGQAAAGREASEAAMRAIRAEAETLFQFLENTTRAKREALDRQAETMVAGMTEAWERFEQLVAASAGTVGSRLAALGDQADALDARLQAGAGASEQLALAAEKAFQRMEARVGHSTETARAALDRLGARLDETSGSLAGLTKPLREMEAASQALDGAVASLGKRTLEALDVLAATLPARTVEASRTAETLTGEIEALVRTVDAAHARAVALAEPIEAGRARLDEASAAFAAERERLAAMVGGLEGQLTDARVQIAAVEESARETALAAATGLVEAMARVRDVAGQATGTMRETLETLIGEARTSLADAADSAARQSFVEPIARNARAAESAAAAAAERTAASMAALASTLGLLEARSQERLEALEAARQQELLAASVLLTDRLAASAVRIASALGRPMDDADWARWRRGERSLFNRRAVSLLDRAEARELKGLVANDADFRDEARRYTLAFEDLVVRLEADGLAALAVALWNSDQGRLAAALTEALEG